MLGGLLLLVIYILSKNASAHIIEPAYDPDSLVYMSSDIVEGCLVNGPLTVTMVHAGGLHVGQQIFVRQLYAYRKGFDSLRTVPLTSHDRLILFLARENGTNNFNLVGSGAFMIWRGSVYGFADGSFFGGPPEASLGVLNSGSVGSTTVGFRQSLLDRLKEAKEWRARFAKSPTADDVPWLLALIKERAPLSDPYKFGYCDVISAKAIDHLVSLHDFPSDEDALVLTGWTYTGLWQAFNSTDGVKYVIRRLSTPGVPLANRTALSRLMRYDWVMPATRPSSYLAERSLSRLGELATINAADEEVAVNVIGAVGPTTQMATDFKKDHIKSEYLAALRPLIDLYDRPSTSEAIRYQIEVSLWRVGMEYFDQLKSKSGPILSQVKEPWQRNVPSQRSAVFLDYDFVSINTQPAVTATELVFKAVQDGKELAVPFGFVGGQPGSMSSGGGYIPLPSALLPGKYRLFFRFKSGAVVVGEGHSWTTTLPQQFPAVLQYPLAQWRNAPTRMAFI